MPSTLLLYILIFGFIKKSTCSVNIVNNQELGKNITKILNSYFSSEKYDKRVRPNYGGKPVEVGVTLYILTISSVSEVQMDFTTDFYFRQVWTDSRLSFTETDRIKELSVGAEVANKIWVPDTFFANEKSAYFHEATKMNTFLRIGSEGKVYRSIRLTVTANCPMDLQYFPMDRQKCTIEIESYGYSMSDIIYFWKDGEKSIGIDESLTLPQFKISSVRQRDKKIVLSTGNYSRLLCEIQLTRSMGYYMIQIYIPAFLIVMISWVSFWLHRNATPARVQLGVVTVLTMTTLMSSTNSQLPKISYVKSIDVFLGTCFVMVFAALVEYAAVGYIGKRISMRKNRYQQSIKAKKDNEKNQRKFLNQNTQSNNQTMTSSSYCPVNSNSRVHQNEIKFETTRIKEINEPQTIEEIRCNTDLINNFKLYKNCVISPNNLPNQHSIEFNAQNTLNIPVMNNNSHQSNLKIPNNNNFSINISQHPNNLSNKNNLPKIVDREYPNSFSKNLDSLFGISPSDIDKYSRVLFPALFICFNSMYWFIFMHISSLLESSFNAEDE